MYFITGQNVLDNRINFKSKPMQGEKREKQEQHQGCQKSQVLSLKIEGSQGLMLQAKTRQVEVSKQCFLVPKKT